MMHSFYFLPMSRKLFITLILILFLLPFVSWYYLKSGLEWRKQAQQLMSGTALFPEGQFVDMSGATLVPENITDHVTLVTRLPCDDTSTVHTLDLIYNQFKETKKANFILLHDCETIRVDSVRSGWLDYSCKDTSGLCAILSKGWPSGKNHALIDRERKIRSYYSSSTQDEKRILLEHMALLLPRERSEKVELKRGDKR
jgi:hypothetical protein